jgi:hypothetical protein
LRKIVVEVVVRDQLDDVAATVQEVEGGCAAVGVDDGRPFFDVRIVVEGKQFVTFAKPCSRVLDATAWDVDCEVILGVEDARGVLEAD